GQHAAVGGEAVGLEREDEPVGRFITPLGEGGRFHRAVVGAVDLDGGHLAAGVFQLACLRPTLGVEVVAPGLEGPATDADPDFGAHRRLHTTKPSRPMPSAAHKAVNTRTLTRKASTTCTMRAFCSASELTNSAEARCCCVSSATLDSS